MKNVFHIVTDEEAKSILDWQEVRTDKVRQMEAIDDTLHNQGIYTSFDAGKGLHYIHEKAWRMLADTTMFRAFVSIAQYGRFDGVMDRLVGKSNTDEALTREHIDAVNYELTWREGHYVEMVAREIEERIFQATNWRSDTPLKMRPLKNLESFRCTDGYQDSYEWELFDALSLLETGTIQEFPEKSRDGRYCSIKEREHETIYFTASGCQNGNIRLKLTTRGKAVLTELFNTFPYVERKAA